MKLSAELLVEFINSSAGINEFLLACKERMAFRANFNMEIVLCGLCMVFSTTRTYDYGILVLRMDVLFHFQHLFFSDILRKYSSLYHTRHKKVNSF